MLTLLLAWINAKYKCSYGYEDNWLLIKGVWMIVYIVINTDLGWDNIIGIFENSIDAVRCNHDCEDSIVENYVEKEYKSEWNYTH